MAIDEDESVGRSTVTWRLTWNPAKTNSEEAKYLPIVASEVRDCREYGFVDSSHACGNSHIAVRDTVLLCRTGTQRHLRDLRGRIGVGRATLDAVHRGVTQQRLAAARLLGHFDRAHAVESTT